MNNIEIGKRIKDTRIRKGLTLEDIAREIGVAKSTIQRYENGKIDRIKLPVITAIANVLGVNDAWLIGKDDRMVLTDAEKFGRFADQYNKTHFPEEEADQNYYVYDDAKELAEFLFRNPEYRVLFDASRKVKKEDLEIVKELLDRFS